MASADAFNEVISSQLPALQLLINLGWQYLTPSEALALRGGKEKNVVLTGVLEPWLRSHNSISFKGRQHAFSDASIRDAVGRLVDEPLQSLMVTNAHLYELLTLETSVTQAIDGDRKSFSLRYVDWHHPENKRYGDEDAYLRETIASFARPDGVEILVVVDKLLTGFDEPRNTVLYVDKPLKEHTLLQAISRVNRLAENKDFGYISDYRGVLGELNEALNLYDALAEYDAEDISGISEVVDYRDYEGKIRKLMDDHIRATGTTTITELVNVFDAEKFDAEVEKLGEPAAKADTILNRMKRTIGEHLDEDPSFYRRFSELVEESIRAFRQGRIDQLEYLKRARMHLDDMRTGWHSGAPERLARYQHAPAYYGILREAMADYHVSDERIADVAIKQESIIEANKVTDWDTNLDVQKRIKRELDDSFYDLEQESGVEFDTAQLDVLIDQIVEVAKSRIRRRS